MKNRKSCLFFAFIFYLLSFLFSCDLFSGDTDNDLLKKIDAEIAWANAAKLTVHVSHDPAWGTSNPPMGQITPARDIRLGYDFTIEFTPDAAFALAEWRAFSGELPASWWDDLVQFEIDVQGSELEIDRDFVLMSSLSSRGGSSTLKINVPGTIDPGTAVPGTVTLVPWCRTEPRITRTEPRFTPGAEFSKGAIINIYFNGPLAGSSIYDAITMRGITNTSDEDYLLRYTVEYFEVAGQYVLTFTPKPDNMPDIDTEIKLTIKTGEGGIQNAQGEWMAGDDIVYVWKTLNFNAGNVTSWGAQYNSDNTITISPWQVDGGGRVEVSYTVNRGVRNPLDGNSANGGTIPGVTSINDANVRRGMEVSGIEEYEIIFDIYVGTLLESSQSFKIWNIPGMSVSHNNPAIEVIDKDSPSNKTARSRTIGLTKIPPNAEGQYVLKNNIELSVHDHIADFKGNFYGNGNTITIKGMVPGTNMGLFGIVDGGTVRDLTVAYDSFSLTYNGATNFGGIAGHVTGEAEFFNVLVKGAVDIEVKGDNVSNVGGVIGDMSDEATLQNVYGGLALTVNKTGTTAGVVNNAFTGGIIGSTATGGSDINRVAVSEVTVTANISQAQVAGGMYVGGVVGRLQATITVKNIEFTGYLSASKTDNGHSYIGGIAGYSGIKVEKELDGTIVDDTIVTKFLDCQVSGSISISEFTSNSDVNLGGIMGSSQRISIDNSWASGNLSGNNSSVGHFHFGGLIGWSESVTASNCWYEQGSIISNGTGCLFMGGGFGYLENSELINCFSLATLVSGTRSFININDRVYVGGLAGILYTGQLRGCYAQTDVYASGSTEGFVYAGGLLGYWDIIDISAINVPKSITECYATGNVSATASETEFFAAGGLVGCIFRNQSGTTTVQNSYSLGNVSVNRTGNNNKLTHAGGFVGQIRYQDNTVGTFTIEYCFSAGNVSARSADTDVVYAGGILGGFDPVSENDSTYYGSLTLHSNAAVGTSITAMGSSVAIGRIYGRPLSGAINNYASDTMFLGTHPYTNNPNPSFTDVSPNPSISSDADKDGEHTTREQFAVADDSWTDMLGFSTSIWSFATLSRGYPSLAGLGGQQ